MMGYSIRLIDSVRLVLLSGAWICAIAQILFEESNTSIWFSSLLCSHRERVRAFRLV